jgi:hypothetical protein
MTDKSINILILVGIAKLLSEQSTFLIGEFRHERKQQFNNAIKAVDLMLKTIESGLDDFDKETLLILTESLNDGIEDLRKQLKQK